ncbi:hypothetical protein C8F01DRAFT_1166219 [Mycena amicta]|nr:hypothetical protein C8F01DRAFT_1166219 [Mycena amicta]
MDAATSLSDALRKSLTFEVTSSAVPFIPGATDDNFKDDAISQRYDEDVEATIHFHELRQKHIVPPRELGNLKHGDSSGYSAKYIDTLELGYTSNKPVSEREHHATLQKLVFLQMELIPRVQEMLADGSFVRAWEAMGREKRMNFAHERARVDCPEMSLYGLIGEKKGDGEQDLISLFQEMSTHDGAEGPLCIFRHPKFEEEFHLMIRGLPEWHWKHPYAAPRIFQRLLFISATLAAILDLHAGIPPSPRWFQDITRVYDTCFQYLRKCTGCAYALYCSPRCQKQNWSAHKPLCASTKNIVRIPKPWASLVDVPVSNPDSDEEPITFAEYLRLERAALKWH